MPKKLRSEHEMRAVLNQYLENNGYRVLFPEDLGGGDYFDCVAVGDSVGAIELKLSNPQKAFSQAYARLYYVNWSAVLMPSEKSLNTISKKYDKAERIGRSIGLWHFNGEGIKILREADSGEPRQTSEHTIKMIRRIIKYKELGISNEVAWGHERGISLFGLQNSTKTMYGKKLSNLAIPPLETYD